jgi:hypothetical protein
MEKGKDEIRMQISRSKQIAPAPANDICGGEKEEEAFADGGVFPDIAFPFSPSLFTSASLPLPPSSVHPLPYLRPSPATLHTKDPHFEPLP